MNPPSVRLFIFIYFSFFLFPYLSSLQLQTLHTLFPHFPVKPPYFTRKPHAIKGNPSKSPHFLPLNSRKPHFSLKKPPKPPIFSDFPYFFIQNSGFSSHLTPAALIPYFSLFFPIFRKSSNSRLFPTFPRFLDQKPTKPPIFQ